MKVVVFGATGLTGREVTAEARRRGHEVTAFARPGSEVDRGDVRVVRGELAEGEALATALAGQDAVACCLGAAKPWRRSPALTEGLKTILAAMRREGVERLVYVSALGTGDSRADAGLVARWLVVPVVLRAPYRDHEADEAAIRASGLDWTILRPTRLTREPARGKVRVGPHEPDRPLLGRLPRADLATVVLDAIEASSHVRQAVNVVG